MLFPDSSNCLKDFRFSTLTHRIHNSKSVIWSVTNLNIKTIEKMVKKKKERKRNHKVNPWTWCWSHREESCVSSVLTSASAHRSKWHCSMFSNWSMGFPDVLVRMRHAPCRLLYVNTCPSSDLLPKTIEPSGHSHVCVPLLQHWSYTRVFSRVLEVWPPSPHACGTGTLLTEPPPQSKIFFF